MRTEIELQRKEAKIKSIKEQAETERRIKMEAMGIPDEEDIIRFKREREERIKMQNGFNIETFEQKYDRELKKRADMKKKLEEDRVEREREQYTFQPDLARQRTKSPNNVINRGSLTGP